MTTFFHRLRRHQKGFTLIELLVVVAIIALLATFAVPRLFDAINKSKKAPGQADLNTISSALERYYMDNNKYPVPTTTPAATVDDLLVNGGYLKATTTFRNGFKQQYLYGTTSTGSGYVLIDMQGAATTSATTQTVTCGAGAGQTYTFTLDNDATHHDFAVNATIAAADLANCVAPTDAALTRN